jgi:hypothetical protein
MASILQVETLQGPTSGVNANKITIPAGHTLDASAGTFTPSSGQIIQVRTQSYYNDTRAQFTNTSSYADTELVGTITPTSASSKILITINLNVDLNTGNSAAFIAVFRNAIDISSQDDGPFFVYQADTNAGHFQINGCIEDSPNTTDEITYSVKVKANASQGLEYRGDYSPPMIVMQEIAG